MQDLRVIWGRFRRNVSAGYLITQGVIAVLLSNRVGMKDTFERFCYDSLKSADHTVFDKEFFKDVDSNLKTDLERQSRLNLWANVALCLLVLCMCGVLNTFTFQGAIVDIQKFSPVLFLIYSATTLQLLNIKSSIFFRESLLRAHSRRITSEKDLELYRFRFQLRDVPPFALIYNRRNVVLPERKSGNIFAKSATVLIIFILAYFIFIWIVAIYCLLSPGFNIIIRVLIVLISLIIQMFSFVSGLSLEFAAGKRSGVVKEYVQRVSEILKSKDI
jgi:hypothetical protein